jgi:hypothetical protein
LGRSGDDARLVDRASCIRRKRRTAAGARADLRDLMVEARRNRFTLEEIGRAAGLTPQRVSQITNDIRPAGTTSRTAA